MGWISTLSETYDCISGIGSEDAGCILILPISHSTQNAQIEVDIDLKGNFIGAGKVDKSDAVTIIPVTEDSGTRSSGIAPHPLCDKLCYIAKDYSDYGSKKDMTAYFNAYIENLGEWAESEYTHKKVKAIWNYLKQGTLIRDLLKCKILELDENGILSEKINKMQTTTAQPDAFVRFKVLEFGERTYYPATWMDQSLFQSFVLFYEKGKTERDLCYISGEQAACSDKHPSKIRHTGDKAKLISANDSSGFTFRGRFKDKSQAISVGYVSSQKAHNALRWLIQNQGYTRDSTAIVAWETKNHEIPNIFHDSDDLLGSIPVEYNIGENYADHLANGIKGYYAELDTPSHTVAVIALDAATTGRLSITFYREIRGSEFLERIINWHKQCSWLHYYKKKEDGSYYAFTGAPTPKEIVLSAFGTEQNGLLKVKDALMKSTIERLMPCIIDGQKLPYDIVKAAVNHAGQPMAMSGFQWQKVLSHTCALIKKYHYDKNNKEGLDMILDREMKGRSYLFGRLLAIVHKAEYRTFERGESRDTNAKRYWNTFTIKPAKTWDIIYKKLLPYRCKLKPGERSVYEKLIGEVILMFEYSEFSNLPLDETYLLGYWCQIDDLKYKNEDEVEDKTNE